MCVCAYVCIIYNAKKNFPLFEILSLELLTTLFCFFFACILFFPLFSLFILPLFPRYFRLLAILLPHCLSFFQFLSSLRFFIFVVFFVYPFFYFYFYSILTCTCLFFFNAISFQQFSLYLGIIG